MMPQTTFLSMALTLIIGVGLIATPSPASASVDDCLALIDDLLTELDTVAIGGGNPDRTRMGLEKKLGDATDKLLAGKLLKAIDKLGNFQDKVLLLAGGDKPKMDPEDAASLAAGAQLAIDCILDLIED